MKRVGDLRLAVSKALPSAFWAQRVGDHSHLSSVQKSVGIKFTKFTNSPAYGELWAGLGKNGVKVRGVCKNKVARILIHITYFEAKIPNNYRNTTILGRRWGYTLASGWKF
jgi:hypothetical protein